MDLSPDLARWILRSTTDGIWVFDDAGRTTYANEQLARILGREHHEMPGLSVFDTLDETGRGQFREHLARLAADPHEESNVECSLLLPDGARIWALVSHSPLVDDDGVRRGWLHRVTELTDRRQLLEQLRASEQQLVEAQSIAKVGSWEWDVARDVVTWSDELYRMYELRPGELEASYQGFLARIHPDDRPRAEAAVGSVFAGADTFEFEARILRSGGSVGWVRGRGRVTRDARGAPVRMGGTAQDVSEAVAADRALAAASSRLSVLQRMTAAANESSSLAEAVGTAVSAIAELTGWRPRAAYAVTGDRLHGLPLDGTPPPPAGEHVRRVLRTGVTSRSTSPVPGAQGAVVTIPVLVDGEVCCLLELDSLAEDGAGAPETVQQVVGQLAQVAERERSARELAAARDEAMAASRMKSDFLATMSHEIRTPLNGVIGLSGLLLDTALDEGQRQLAHGVDQAGRTLLGLVNDVLDLSKVEAGKLVLEDVDFAVRDVVERVASLVTEPARAKGVEVMAGVDRDVPTLVRGDPVRLGQVLTNLLSNAVKFTAAGEVAVQVRVAERSAGRVTLDVRVRDTGVGIPLAAQERLFEAFTQADTSTTREYGGTGLGLAISTRLVQALGGEIGVDSEPGQGSTFWFTAVLREAEAGTAHEPDPPLPDGIRVLVVDDSETNRFILRELLASWGVSAETASSAGTALDVLAGAVASGRPFDLALVDLCMPGTDGLGLARQVREDPSVRDLPLVLLASATGVDEGELSRLGIRRCLPKPVARAELRDVVAQALGARPAAAEQPRTATAPPARGRVLVAEDNEVNQVVARGMLQSLGYRVHVVDDGHQAVAALADGHDYAVVLMDCQMPGLDGYAATRAIRGREPGSTRVPVIAMTAAAIAGERERCLAAGMDDFLVKPVARDLLASTLARWVEAAAPPLSGRPAGTEDGRLAGLDLERLRMLRDLDPEDASMFHRFLDSFLSSAPSELERLRTAVDGGDSAALARAAHRFRGSAENLGAVRLGSLLLGLESAGDRGDRDTAARLLVETEPEVGRTTAAMRRVRDGGVPPQAE